MVSFGSDRQWTLSTEGLSSDWAFLIFLICSAAVVFAYFKFAPDIPAWRRYTMMGLRILIIGIVLFLLTKPMLNLTLTEPVRQSLLVMLDISQSLTVADHRERPEDLSRAAIAVGLLDPNAGVKQKAPAETVAQLGTIPRWDLLVKLAGNEKLNLWPQLQREEDLSFYQFGREASSMGAMPMQGTSSLTNADAVDFFKKIHPDKPATAIGESVRQVLQETRGQSISGIFLITDGQNNIGSSPLEAAEMAHRQNVPLFIYGVGVTASPDLSLQEITIQKLAFVDEIVNVRAKIGSVGYQNKIIPVKLMADGIQVDEQNVTIHDDGEYDVNLHFTPVQPGDIKLEVTMPVLPDETVKDNNSGTAKLRVTDAKFHVLLIEQEPRWDFRYLLAYLQRDRHLNIHAVMIDGEPDLDQDPDSPFLPGLPQDRDTLFNSQVLILGDVNPEDLGDERMLMIQEWVEAGGGIIFLAGPNFNPASYIGTPLEPLLPVVPEVLSHEEAVVRTTEPFKLQLTPLGEISPYLQMDPDPDENRRIWDQFPGVRWTAAVSRLKPGADALLLDSRSEKVGRYGSPPVFAMQGYGAGTCVYFGTDETYRWRSGVGEKYYSILWGQIMQSLSLQLLEGGSAHTQLKTDRVQYMTGDKVIIAGKAYKEGFELLLTPTLEGTVAISSTDAAGKKVEQKQPLNLSAVPDTKGYRGEFIAKVPGEYSFTTKRDPEASLKFEVIEPRLEKNQTALNERLLKTMADISGGRFLREEDLSQMPKLVNEKRATVTSFQKLEIYYSFWWLIILLLLAFLEWLLRRLSQLK